MLLVLTLALHLICVNVASAGPIVCMWLEWRAGRGDKLSRDVGVYLSSASLVTLVLGVALGLGVGTLLWDDAYSNVIQRFPRRIYYGLIELAFSAVLMAIHALWWQYTKQSGGLTRSIRYLLLLAAGTNLLYHFPFLFAIISNVAAARDQVTEPLDSEFTRMIADPAILSRALHFILAAFAVTGVALIGYAMKLRRSDNESDAERCATWGGRLALVPTLLQVLVGIWVVLSLPAGMSQAVMGSDIVATALLGTSILLSFGMMHALAAISFGDASKKKLILAMTLMFVIVVLMTGVLRRTKPTPQTASLKDGNIHARVSLY